MEEWRNGGGRVVYRALSGDGGGMEGGIVDSWDVKNVMKLKRGALDVDLKLMDWTCAPRCGQKERRIALMVFSLNLKCCQT